jgi:probable non-F420 flavinoid oxidoreductase
VTAATGTIGYHASHEQFAPSTLADLAVRAERAGFGAVLASDHFMPWSESQGESGFVWSWLGAAMARTSLPFATVSAPGQRYHPAILAQAIATIAEMFPRRLVVAMGSGEALNEHITGDRWPTKSERNARLSECIDVTRRLLAGEWVDHRGVVCVQEAHLYTRPAEPPPLFAAAITPETAAWAGRWADGMITVNQPEPGLRRTIDAFRELAGPDAPVWLQVHISWAEREADALAAAHDQWRTNVFGQDLAQSAWLPAHFDAAAEHVGPESLHHCVEISDDLSWHRDRIAHHLAMGIDRVYCHNVGRNQDSFIDAFGSEVLPKLEQAA